MRARPHALIMLRPESSRTGAMLRIKGPRRPNTWLKHSTRPTLSTQYVYAS